MATPTGPTVPRWQLGDELARLRRGADLGYADVAAALACSESKIRRIEAGEVGTSRVELMFLLDLYGVHDPEVRRVLLELQKLGKQRGWWARFGSLPTPFTTFLGLEAAATGIRYFELAVVPGLLQTEAYAAEVTRTSKPDISPAEVDRWVQVRMARQDRVLLSQSPPKIHAVLDEAALRRLIGGPAVMRAQLEHLQRMSELVTVQVVPFGSGGYPGTLGPFTIFQFERRTPVVYVEGGGGNLYLEREDDVSRCTLMYGHMRAIALNPAQSADRITELIKELS